MIVDSEETVKHHVKSTKPHKSRRFIKHHLSPARRFWEVCFDTAVDHHILNRKGLFLNRKQTKRAQFRSKHHYFSYLKYWSIYQEKFSYLDSKSQGLLAISAILTGVFGIFLSGTILQQAKIYGWIALAAIMGVILLVVAQLMLLRCFSTTADRKFHRHDRAAERLESRIKSGGSTNYFGRTRILEANLNKFLSLHLEMLQSIEPEHTSLRFKLQEVWGGIRARDDDSFDDFEEYVSAFFGTLRDSVEQEIEHRHCYYRMAKHIVALSLILLNICVSLLGFGLAQAGMFSNLLP